MKRRQADISRFIRLLWWKRAIAMLERTEEYDEILKDLALEKSDDKFARIRCPACKWRPDASSRWTCCDPAFMEHPTGGCHRSWNTFDTRGICPGCRHQWIKTTCLRCGVHSPHEDWYENKE
jgi:hypothetical protein